MRDDREPQTEIIGSLGLPDTPSTLRRLHTPTADPIAVAGLPLAAAPALLHTPAFTLASSLTWLDHQCPGWKCYRGPLESMRASVWFLLEGQRLLATRVIVEAADTGAAPAGMHDLLERINECTRRDAIDVRYPSHRARGTAIHHRPSTTKASGYDHERSQRR